MRKSIVILLTALLVMAVFVAGCGTNQAAAPKTNELVVTFGTDAEYPPFEKQQPDGSITGFDADILQAVAKAGGFKATLVHTGWDPLFADIDSGKVDAGISAITITDDRKLKYDFSDPYFDAKQLILVPAGSTVKSLQDLKGKRIGVQTATTGEAAVQKAFGKTYVGLKGYDDTPGAIDDLRLGRLDAVVADNGVVIDYVKTLGNVNFKFIDDPYFGAEHYGIMVKKGNSALLAKINAGIAKIKADGTYAAIYNKYFGH